MLSGEAGRKAGRGGKERAKRGGVGAVVEEERRKDKGRKERLTGERKLPEGERRGGKRQNSKRRELEGERSREETER